MRSPFFKNHLESKAKIIDFHGWEMPLQYSGIIDEHKNVRESVGLFDVSHMGRFKIKGDAESQIQHLITNNISKITSFDLSKFGNGIYLVKLHSKSNVYYHKVIFSR